MKPRSLVFDLYGDYVRYYDGEIGAQELVGLLGVFGINAQTARVTLSRLKREGWLDTRRAGRSSWYALTSRSWRMLDEGRERIFTRGQATWSGNWHMVIYNVPEDERPVRERLRKLLQWLGFGPLGPSTWISAHDRNAEFKQLLIDRDIAARYDVFTAQTGSLQLDRTLAARCWDLDALHGSYLEFTQRYQSIAQDVRDKRIDDETCFVQRLRMVHDYRKFPFMDPDLPRELLPQDWVGARAHALFLATYEQLHDPATRYFEHWYKTVPAR